MTWFSRLGTLLLALCVTALAGVFLGILWTGADVAVGQPDLLQGSFRLVGTPSGRWLATGVAALLVLVALLTVIAAWSRGRHLIAVRSGEGGEQLLVAEQALARHIADAALAADHVERARASVTPDGHGRVAVDLDLRVDEDAEAGAVVSAVDRRVASALEARYGLRMSRRPNVEVRHVVASRRHRGRTDGDDPSGRDRHDGREEESGLTAARGASASSSGDRAADGRPGEPD